MSLSIEKFNGLNGCVVSREDLQHILDLAKTEEQIYVTEKIGNILNCYEHEEFEFESVNPAIECVPSSILKALQYDDINEIEDFNGLQKAVTPNEIYQTITDRMINMINEANLPTYTKKWEGKVYGKGYTIPFNFDSKKRYRGINFLLLTSFEPMENPFYLTFKQIEKYNGKLKKGSVGNIVVYFTKLYKIVDLKKNIDFASYDLKKVKDFAKENGIDTKLIGYLPILKYYNVFNGKNIENIDFDLDNFKIGFIDNELPPANKMPIPEAIIKNYPAPAPKLKHGGDRAFFRPNADIIQMPYMADFVSAQDYYRVLFHELSHSTGDYNRLNRDFTGKFGSKKYAFEELIAEWGATFLSAEAGIIWHNDKNHASYLKNWNSALTHIKEDNKFIMRACTEAQKLTDFILQFDDNGNPLYFKDIAVLDKSKKEAQTLKKTTNKTLPRKKKTVPINNEKFDSEKYLQSLLKKWDDKIKKFTKTEVSELKKLFKNRDEKSKDWSQDWELFLFDYMLYKDNLIRNKTNIPASNDQKLTKKTEKTVKTTKSQQQKTVVKPINKGNANVQTLAKELTSDPGAIENLKVDRKGQIALLGSKPKTVKNSLAERLKNKDIPREYYKISKKDIATLLGNVEIKPKESVAITVAGGQGSGKTTYLFELINEFAQNYKVGHASMEEHPESGLYEKRALKYWNEKTIHTVDAPEIKTIEDLHDLIMRNDVIAIDSFSKLKEILKTLELDKDLRKKYDGKLFIIIYQLTTNNSMRGGSSSQFDGDIIQFVEKHDEFAKNYVYNDKNRYQDRDISTLKYLIASGKLVKEEKPLEETPADKKPKKEVQKTNNNTVIFN